MAEKTLLKAIEQNLIPNRAPTTEDLKLHGYLKKEEAMKIPEPFRAYGSDFEILKIWRVLTKNTRKLGFK